MARDTEAEGGTLEHEASRGEALVGMSPAFFLTALVIVIPPGSGVLYTVAAGLSRGARANMIAAIDSPPSLH